MIIAMGSDHGGFQLKEGLKKHLQEKGFEILDLGTNSEESVDYPVYGHAVGEAVASGKAEKGVVCCGTGIGISIAANKVKGIRCALPTTPFMAEMCKKHNNANVVAFGGRVLTLEQATELLDIWLDNDFEGGRHERRVNMLNEF